MSIIIRIRTASVLGGVLVGVVILITVSTHIIAWYHSILISLIAALFICSILDCNDAISFKFSIRSVHTQKLMIFLSGIIATVLLLFPLEVPIGTQACAEYLGALSLANWSQIIASVYFMSLFPGLAIVQRLPSRFTRSAVERIVMIVWISYFVSTLSVSVARVFAGSARSIMILLVVGLILTLFSLVVRTLSKAEIVSGVLEENVEEVGCQPDEDTVGIPLILVLLCVLVSLSAYLIVMPSTPTHSILSGDIARYVVGTHSFLRNEQVMLPYVWLQAHLAGFSLLTNLSPFYCYVLIQYYIGLIPLSFYCLGRELLGDKSKGPAIMALCAVILISLSSIAVLFTFNLYRNWPNGTWTSLELVYYGFGFPSTLPRILSAQALDIALSMIALSLMIRFIRSNEDDLAATIMAALCIATSILTHSLLLCGIVVVFGFLYAATRRRAYRFLRFTLIFVIVFAVLDMTVGWHIIGGTLKLYFDSYFFFSLYVERGYRAVIMGSIVAGAAILVFVVAFRHRILSCTFRGLNSSLSTVSKKVCSTIAESAGSIFPIGVLAVLTILATVYVINIFMGTVLSICMLVIAAIGPLIAWIIMSSLLTWQLDTNDTEKQSLLVGILWIGCCTIVVTGLAFFLPIPESVFLLKRVVEFSSVGFAIILSTIVARFVFHVRFQSTIDSSFDIRLRSNMKSQSKLRKSGFNVRNWWHVKGRMYLLVVGISAVLTLSSLSYSFAVEHYFLANANRGDYPVEESQTYDWITSMTDVDDILLTCTRTSWLRLSSVTGRYVYAYEGQETVPMTWSIGLLFDSENDVTTLNLLHGLNIRYVVLYEDDRSAMMTRDNGASLLRTIESAAPVYHNSICEIYQVQSGKQVESSDRVLVTPVSNITYSTESVVNEFDSVLDIYPVLDGTINDSISLFPSDVMNHSVWDSSPLAFSYFQQAVNIPVIHSDFLKFRIRGTDNAIYNLGIFLEDVGWLWYSDNISTAQVAPLNWTTIDFHFEGFTPGRILFVDYVCGSRYVNQTATMLWDWVRIIHQNSGYNGLYTPLHLLSSTGQDFETQSLLELPDFQPDKSYLFLDGPGLRPDLMTTLPDSVSSGAEIIFFDSMFASTDDFGHQYESSGLLDRLNVTRQPPIEVDMYCIGGDYSRQLLRPLNVEGLNVSTSSCSVEAWFGFSGEFQSPMILRWQIGLGTIWFVNIKPLLSSLDSLTERAEVLDKVATVLHFNDTSEITTEDYIGDLPLSLFRLRYPTISNILSFGDLDCNLFSLSNVDIVGSITLHSSRVVARSENLHFQNLRLFLSNGTEVLFESGVAAVLLDGFLDCTITCEMAKIESGSMGSSVGLELLDVTGLTASSQEVGAGHISLTIESSGQIRHIDAGVDEIEMNCAESTLQGFFLSPTLELFQATLSMKWLGLIWYDNVVYSTVSTPKDWGLSGTFTLYVVACAGYVHMQVMNMSAVKVTV